MESNGFVCVLHSPETYEAVREGVARAFPSHKATMEHFDQYLGIKLVESCPQGLHKAVRLSSLSLSCCLPLTITSSLA